MGIAKDQYKLSKDQLNVIDNNREDDDKADGVRVEDGKIDNVNYRYIGDKY